MDGNNNGLIQGAKMLANKASNKLKKLMIKLVIHALPWIGGLILLLGLASLVYGVVFETRGTEQTYTLSESQTEGEGSDGTQTSTLLSSDSARVLNFYQYYAKKAYWQLIGDASELKQTQIGTSGVKEVKDYYNREAQFSMNANFLFALDDYMFQNKIMFPEQFTKPVAYDESTLMVKDITDDTGAITLQSVKYDENGKATTDEIAGEWDYGLATVYKYMKDEEKLTIQGKVFKKEYFDYETNTVYSEIVDEPFNPITMAGYPKDIYVIEKAITFAGEYSWTYEDTTKVYKPLEEGVGERNSSKTQYVYDYGYIYDEYGVVIDTVPLHAWREGAVYKTVPTPTSDGAQTRLVENNQYLYDYLNNFEAYLPDTVMTSFDFVKRVGTLINSDFKVGDKVGNGSYDKAVSYLSIIQAYCNTYQVDPYIIVAIIAAESSGNPKATSGSAWGLTQIEGDGVRTATCVNPSTGATDSFTVYNISDREDPDKNIHWAVMNFKNNMDTYGGDALKAIQCHNLPAVLSIIARNHPAEYKSLAWLNYREEARIESGKNQYGTLTKSADYSCNKSWKNNADKTWGNVCYIEDVLKFYDNTAGTYNDLNNFDIQAIDIPDYGDDAVWTRYKKFATNNEVEYILRYSYSMENKVLFSDNHYGDLQFWDSNYVTTFQSDYASYTELIAMVPGIMEYKAPFSYSGAKISTPFGIVSDETGSYTHNGVDVALPLETPIFAVSGGVVLEVCTSGGSGTELGNYVKIKQSDGGTAIYASLSKVSVKSNDIVSAGAQIGTSGQSGVRASFPQLHFEFYASGGVLIDPTYIVLPIDWTLATTEIGAYALSKLGMPYIWGAEGPDDWDGDGETSDGYDCSGFVSAVYWHCGYDSWNRETVTSIWYKRYQDYGTNYDISSTDDYANLQPNDLMMLDTCGKEFNHIGIYLGYGKFIHCGSHGVSIASLDNPYWQGIFHHYTRPYASS